MKIKTIILSAALVAPAVLSAQPTVASTDAQGYLERGRLMYESHNYVGAIDQLSRVSELTASATLQEQADYYLCLSRQERDEAGVLQGLHQFLAKYPSSTLVPDVLMRIGNYHFYHGDYGDALVAYTQVRQHSLDQDLDEDLVYRMAYCDLQLGSYSDAQALYATLKGTKRYDNAQRFYDAYIAYANHRYSEALEKFGQVDRIGDLGYQAQYYVCQIDFNHKNYDEVISLGNSLLADDVNQYFNPEIHRLVGESYYHKASYKQARQHLDKYISTTQDPVVRSASYALGVMDYDAGSYRSAVKNLGLVTGKADELGQSAYLYLGQAELKLGDSKAAALAFGKAAQMDFDKQVKETAFYNYAVSQSKGNATPFGNSITLFEQFLNDYPKSKYRSQVEDYLVTAYTTSGNYQKALESIARISNPSAKVLSAKQEVLYNLGVQAMQKGDKKTAASYLRQAIAVGKYNKQVANESRLWLAEAEYDMGDYGRTAGNLRTYLKNASKTDANYAKAQYDLGYALYQQKKYADARDAFQKAVKAGTLDKSLTGDAYNRIGDTYYYAQDFSTAEDYYSKAVTSGAQPDVAMLDLAMMKGLRGDKQGKIDQLNTLLKTYPQSTTAPTALLEKGRAQEALGHTQEAVKTYDQVFSRYPRVAEARKAMLQKALAERNLGNQDEALASYKKVVTMAPTSQEAKVAAEDMRAIYADRGQLGELDRFLKSVPNAPQFDVSEADRLTFQAAEKAATAAKPSIAKMKAYLQNYPQGAYVAQANYYVGRYNYEQGKWADALTSLDEALSKGSDATFAEDALTMKADILRRQGKTAEAIDTYQAIADKSSSEDNRISAQLGILRSQLELGRWTDALTTADVLLQNSNLSATEASEVTLDRAIANYHAGNATSARQSLRSLAKDMNTATGAQAAYELAAMEYDGKRYKNAETQVNKLIESGTTQAYWIARGYLLLADIYHAQGKNTEACEYLQSLKANYPGKEQDIFTGISSRLGKWQGKTEKQIKASTGPSKSSTGKRRNANSSADNTTTAKKRTGSKK